MEANQFYACVSSWIKSCRNTESLQWLRRFVNSSLQHHGVKEQLHREMDQKLARLQHLPCFAEKLGHTYLADDNGHPKVFTTRFSAICKVTELKMKGYEVELKPGSVFYKIKLTTPAPINEYAIAG